MTCFQAFTGLKVNVGKSEIVPIGEVSNIQSLASILQCRVGNLPMTYLVMPLGTSYKTSSIWNPILEPYLGKDGEEVVGLEASFFIKWW